MEEEEEEVALAHQHVVVVGHAVEAVHEQPRDVADRLLALELMPACRRTVDARPSAPTTSGR